MTAIFKGDRVAIQPHSDIFMMGERFGEVTSIGRKWIHVKGERSGRTFKFWKGGDSLETTAARVTLNEEQELYVIRYSEGYSCLGFDVCEERATKYLEWCQARGLWGPSVIIYDRGTLARFEQYEALCNSIHRQFVDNGERCLVALTPQLVGLEGKRVEVVDSYGETRRFRVGRSTGWIPVHLEIEGNADGGGPAYGAPYQSVRAI